MPLTAPVRVGESPANLGIWPSRLQSETIHVAAAHSIDRRQASSILRGSIVVFSGSYNNPTQLVCDLPPPLHPHGRRYCLP